MRPFLTHSLHALAACVWLTIVACTSAPRPVGTPIDAATARATFEQVWNAVDTGDADPAHGGVDWAQVKAEFQPRALSCTTREQLRDVLDQMLARLGRSHFGIASGRARSSATASNASSSAAEPGTLGLTLRRLGDRVVVTAVREGSPADRAGVKRGWTVRSVDGTDPVTADPDTASTGPMVRYVREASAAALDHGRVGVSQQWALVDAQGEEHRLTLQPAQTTGGTTRLGVLQVPAARCTDRTLSKEELAAMGVPTDLRVAVVEFNIWLPTIAADIDDAVDRHRDADGMVLDLRGNPGGVGAMCMGVAGHFHDAPDSLGTMRTRDTTLEFRVNPRRSTADGRAVRPFAGPLVILVDPLTASTSEIFAAGLQSLHRAHVVGRTSAGAALPAQMRELPSGDVLLFAFADFTTPDGRHIEGVGVQPDEIVGTNAAIWSADVDPDLQAAARHISKALRDQDCH